MSIIKYTIIRGVPVIGSFLETDEAECLSPGRDFVIYFPCGNGAECGGYEDERFPGGTEKDR